MQMIKGKCCHKCGGKSVYLDYDYTPGCWYEHCLICGYTAPLAEIEPEKKDEASWPNDVSIEA